MDSLHEEWRPLAGQYTQFDYEVSSAGRVRRSPLFQPSPGRGRKTPPGKILKQRNDRGYKIVDLYHEGTKLKAPVHRLVATAFIPNPHSKPSVNHIDGTRDNNCISNLEWCTSEENIRHGLIVHPHRSRVNGSRNPNRKGVVRLKADQKCELVRRCMAGESRGDLAKEFNVSWHTVYRISNSARLQPIS